MPNSNSEIRVADLDSLDFIRYLELSSPDDLDIFAEDAYATLRIDPYGLPPTTVRSKSITIGTDCFPSRPHDVQLYHDIGRMVTFKYNKREGCWISTGVLALEAMTKKPEFPKPRKLNY